MNQTDISLTKEELKEKIEILREKMHNASSKKEQLNLSQKLDELIVKYISWH